MDEAAKIIVKQGGYFTTEQVDELCEYIVELVKNDKSFVVENGKDGVPGKDGKHGMTPAKGIDYWTKAEKQEIIDEVLKFIKIPKPQDGVSPDINEVVRLSVEEIKKQPVDVKKLLSNPQLRMLMHGGGASTNALNVWEMSQRSNVPTLTSSGGVATPDFTYQSFNMTTTENFTLANPTNAPTLSQQQSGVILITQGATPRTISYGSAWKWAGGTPGVLTASAGAIDAIVYNYQNGIAICSIYNDIS